MKFSVPEPLHSDHHVEEFTCGNSTLDEWLIKRALANQISGASRTFVTRDENGTIAGYYSLSTGAINRAELPRAARHGAPQPVPVLLIGRFAVATQYQGSGIGRSLLQDALIRCARLLEDVAFMFVLVHPIDDAADSFWRYFGFTPAPTIEPMLLLPLKQLQVIAKMVN